MRLYYQIFEKSLVEVPLKIENKIPDDYVPTKNDSASDASELNSSNAVTSEEEPFKPVHSEPDCTTKNLKRKCDTSTKKCESETTAPATEAETEATTDVELPEPSVKIPRISDDLIFEEDSVANDELTLPLTTEGSENDSQMQITTTPSHDSGLFSDDYVKYEQDIEEVDEEDDDDYDDRLRISEGEAHTDKTESTGEQPVVDTSDFETSKEGPKEEKRNEKRTKYRRKSKKSKHHHKHKNRHHERKKGAAREATIMHSPCEDIMKLKLKLSAPETKHHKQSRRNHKKSPANYFSYSSSSSVASSEGALSPDTIRMSRADEDSQHSHGSEVSAESMDTISSKEEPNATPNRESEVAGKPPADPEKHRSPTSKEKLLQMRAFRPKNIAVVKPEEVDRSAEVTTVITTATTTTAISSDANKTSDLKVPVQVIEINDKPKVTTTILRPTSSSSITVSKITAAEKMMMEQEKRMSVKSDDKPSLEITIVQEPAKTCPSPVMSVTLAESSATSKVNKVLPRTTKPVPPLMQLKSNEPPKSLSITPYPRSAMPCRPVKSNVAAEMAKKINESLMMKKDGTKPSVTISLSGNHFNSESLSGALDLSGKPMQFPADHMPVVSMAQTLLSKKPCGRPNGTAGMTYNPMSSMSSLADGRFMLPELQYSMASPRHTLMHSPKNHKILSSPPRATPKPQAITRPMTNKVTKTNNIPPLNQLRIVPVSSSAETPLPKPGPNQSVRNIPNPSRLLHRHQPINSVGPMISAASPVRFCEAPSTMSRLLSTSCSFTNHKKGNEKCSPNIAKVYLDHPNVMATK